MIQCRPAYCKLCADVMAAGRDPALAFADNVQISTLVCFEVLAMTNTKPMSLMDFVAAAQSQIQEVDATGLQKMFSEKPDLLLVDVRESSEHEQGHLQHAHLVPRGILEAAADINYPKHDEILFTARERPVVLYCATGGRSALAALTLQMMGFKEVYSLAGGFMKWRDSGLPVIQEARFV